MIAEYRNKIFLGDAFKILAELPPKIVQCVVTSPPYWRQRIYAGEQEIWRGGAADCEHAQAEQDDHGVLRCKGCGAAKIPFGWEPTLDCLAWARNEPPCATCYVCTTRKLFQLLHRVLKDDGIVFYNIGDTYAGSGSAGGDFRNEKRKGIPYLHQYKRRGSALKPKDLCLLPQRVALALQHDGWYIRSIIIWSKRTFVEKTWSDFGTGMPESVADRPCNTHEYIIMATKNQRYFYDWMGVDLRAKFYKASSRKVGNKEAWVRNNPRVRWGFTAEELQQLAERGIALQDILANKRIGDVWHINPPQSKFLHFAVFPEPLAEICIRLGTSEKGECAACQKNYIRKVERVDRIKLLELSENAKAHHRAESPTSAFKGRLLSIFRTVGWEKQCDCGADSIPNIVLDPFCGSGTTLLCARKLGRDFIGIEISEEYVEIAKKRLNMDLGLFAEP